MLRFDTADLAHVDDLDLADLRAAAETFLDQYREINRRYRKPDGSLDAAGVQRLTPLRNALKAAASAFLVEGGFAFIVHDSDRDQLPGVLRDLLILSDNGHPHELDCRMLERCVGLLREWTGATPNGAAGRKRRTKQEVTNAVQAAIVFRINNPDWPESRCAEEAGLPTSTLNGHSLWSEWQPKIERAHVNGTMPKVQQEFDRRIGEMVLVDPDPE